MKIFKSCVEYIYGNRIAIILHLNETVSRSIIVIDSRSHKTWTTTSFSGGVILKWSKALLSKVLLNFVLQTCFLYFKSIKSKPIKIMENSHHNNCQRWWTNVQSNTNRLAGRFIKMKRFREPFKIARGALHATKFVKLLPPSVYLSSQAFYIIYGKEQSLRMHVLTLKNEFQMHISGCEDIAWINSGYYPLLKWECAKVFWNIFT